MGVTVWLECVISACRHYCGITDDAALVEAVYLRPIGFEWMIAAAIFTAVLAIGWMRTYWSGKKMKTPTRTWEAVLWGAAIMLLATFGASFIASNRVPFSLVGPRRGTISERMLFGQDNFHLILSFLAGGVPDFWVAESKPYFWTAAFSGIVTRTWTRTEPTIVGQQFVEDNGGMLTAVCAALRLGIWSFHSGGPHRAASRTPVARLSCKSSPRHHGPLESFNNLPDFKPSHIIALDRGDILRIIMIKNRSRFRLRTLRAISCQI